PSDPFVAGYLIYLCEIFVPGIGIGELLNAWGEDTTVIQRIAFAFGLGIAIDTIVLVIRTSGVSVFGFRLIGIDTGTIGFIISIGLVAFFASLLWRRRLTFITKPK